MKLRPVDEEVRKEPEVIRLQKPGEIAETVVPEEPVRLGRPAGNHDESASVLFVPERREIEVRTHEPGIEALIEEASPAEATEQSWGAEAASRHPVPWGWFVLIALAIVAAVVWSLVRLSESEEVADTIREETESALIAEEREEAEARSLVGRIEEMLSAFFAANRAEKWQDMIRQPERVMPLVRDYYSRRHDLPGAMRSLRALEPITLDRRGNFWMASVMLANGEQRSLLIEIAPDGRPLVDWETFVCHQPMPWDDFARKRPEERPMDFRVYVEADNFYSHEFADSNKWLSFRLTALDAEETLFGYLPRDHEDLPAIFRNLRINDGRKTSLILRLNVPRGLQSRRGVVIQKLMSPRWLYMDSPPKES
ncbi:MAG TPA: hypothetical protein VLO11_03405 [Luteolibacter sp.]|nr:hypothetical protein [Luteolibacter sp.]